MVELDDVVIDSLRRSERRRPEAALEDDGALQMQYYCICIMHWRWHVSYTHAESSP